MRTTVINGMRPASLSVAARVLGHPGGSGTLGSRSVAGSVTVPFTSVPRRFGTRNVHGGVEYQRLGERDLFS